MRLVTFQSAGAARAGIVLADGRILDAAQAIQGGQASGLVAAHLAVPASVLDIISGGEEMLIALGDAVSAVQSGSQTFAVVSMSDADIVAPIPRPLKNVFCVGSNYRAHVSEASRAQAKEDKTPKDS